jgi:hypothetical protein
MKGKPGGLTIDILLGKGKGAKPGMGSGDEPDPMADEDDGADYSEGELPPGLVEAAKEMREATTDEDYARALMNALECCR